MGKRGNKSNFIGCMVAIRDASYSFQSILVKGNILAHFSFFENIRPMKRVCPFNMQFYEHFALFLYFAIERYL